MYCSLQKAKSGKKKAKRWLMEEEDEGSELVPTSGDRYGMSELVKVYARHCVEARNCWGTYHIICVLIVRGIIVFMGEECTGYLRKRSYAHI